MLDSEPRFYDFGPFRVDAEDRVLLRDGQVVPLGPKLFDVLLALVRSGGRVVEKDELMREVWPDTFVEEGNLARNISTLRRVLAEQGDPRQYIETLPRRGYRFVAPAGETTVVVRERAEITVEREEEVEVASAPAPIVSRPRARAVRGLVAVAAVATAAAVATTAFLAGRGTAPSSQPTFRRLTFRRGLVSGARFAPDGRTVVYSAAWEGEPDEVYSVGSESPESRPLALAKTRLMAISRAGELALLVDWRGEIVQQGTLARMPMSSQAPREILEDVQEADWGPNGSDLAVIRWRGGTSRLEYPVGTVRYEAPEPAWISNMRVSPAGDLVAFLDHPAQRYDVQGSVAVVDGSGARRTLAGPYAAVEGLAWSASGDEIVFAASEDGANASVYAVTLSGKVRLLCRLPGFARLEDVAPDGTLLVTREEIRIGMVCLAPGAERECDLSWLDGSWLRDVSSDGRTLLFDEENTGAGAAASTYLRRTDGSPAVRLGEGNAVSLSPDGRWALARVRAELPPRLVVWPTGAGEPRTIAHETIAFDESGLWFPDNRRLLLVGAEPGRPSRTFVHDLGAGATRAVTPEGVVARLLSPDGRLMIASDGAAGTPALYDADGAPRGAVPGLTADDILLRWTDDVGAIFVGQGRGPFVVYRLDLATGRRERVREIPAADPTGLVTATPPTMTPDGRGYAYTYYRNLTDIYQITIGT